MAVDSVVCWKWRPRAGYRSSFGAETVNVLRRMVARHYARPHRFICVTDDAAGIDPAVEVQDIGGMWADIPNPSWAHGPSCYRRLALFAPDAGDRFGARYVSLDLDAVILGDLAPLWDRAEPIVLWSDPLFAPKGMYNASMMLIAAGAAPEVFTRFDPQRSPDAAKRAGALGSDQGWISHCLGPGRPAWSTADGVYSFSVHLMGRAGRPPAGARIVFFHGPRDPWSRDVQRRWPWVRESWR